MAAALGICRTTPYNRAVVGNYETYSKRLRKRERAGQPDVYQYDDLPESLRVQVTHIWNRTIGSTYPNAHHFAIASRRLYNFIKRTLCSELGVFSLSGNTDDSDEEQCKHLLLQGSTLHTLDVIELSFRMIKGLDALYNSSDHPQDRQQPDDAVAELNYRFREHGVGYQFEGGEIVRVDSQYIHAEAVKPAIALLNTAGFKGPSEEFLDAHEHYRQREYADAIADALKAFESTMKAICDENGWTYNKEKDAAKALIKTVLDNNLVPGYMELHLAGLRNTLGAGLPTVRNKLGGHGQGKEPRKVPGYFAGYALHLAATNIVFLVEAHEALNQK